MKYNISVDIMKMRGILECDWWRIMEEMEGDDVILVQCDFAILGQRFGPALREEGETRHQGIVRQGVSVVREGATSSRSVGVCLSVQLGTRDPDGRISWTYSNERTSFHPWATRERRDRRPGNGMASPATMRHKMESADCC